MAKDDWSFQDYALSGYTARILETECVTPDHLFLHTDVDHLLNSLGIHSPADHTGAAFILPPADTPKPPPRPIEKHSYGGV